MLIRSQDKEKLINLNQVTDVVIQRSRNNKKNEIKACLPYSIMDDCAVSNLGEYSTEEKAIKVLDMIERFYSNLQYTRFVGSDYAGFFDVIFQMPQEEDVKV